MKREIDMKQKNEVQTAQETNEPKVGVDGIDRRNFRHGGMILHRRARISRVSFDVHKISRDAVHNLRQTRIARHHMAT